MISLQLVDEPLRIAVGNARFAIAGKLQESLAMRAILAAVSLGMETPTAKKEL
jgi:hypothetical protein